MTVISRIRLPALVLAVAACGGNVNVVRQQKLELQNVNLPLRTFAFPSGLRVVVEKDTRTPLAGVFVVVGSGSSSDPKGKEGLAHYVEHLAFQSRPFGKESFRDMLEAAGAIQWNASTDFDATTYFEIGPAAALPQLLRTEAVRMVIPVSDIADSARAIELDVVRNELRERNETGFNGEVFPRLQSALFPPGHPNASPTGGTQQSLSALTKADVVAFAKAQYRPDNMTLVVLGNLELDKAGDLLADTLPEALVAAPQPVKLPQRLAAVPPPVPAPPPRPAGLPKVEAPIAAPELWIGWSMPRGFD
ncbi:MAG: M16 family metallopeptidase, partial [Myxococcales bacterium]